MERPRLLLVPMLTEVEWAIRPQLEEWAEVASYDAPGIGDEPPVETLTSAEVGRRGVEEADRMGWDRFMIVADEFGVAAAAHAAVQAGPRVQAMAIGHARISNTLEGERPAINREVLFACQSMIKSDRRMFLHQMFKMTGGEQAEGGYQEELVDEFLRRVPQDLMAPFYDSRVLEGDAIGELLAALDVPMLLVQHKGCLMFTDESFQDGVAAHPHARKAIFDQKPSTSAQFAPLLREFCASLTTAQV